MMKRTEGSRFDSDVAFFYDLLNLGELTLKVTVLGLCAAVDETQERPRYRLLHALARSDGLGGWKDAFDELVSGDTRGCLTPTARETQRALSQKFKQEDDEWQVFAAVAMHRACVEVDPGYETLAAQRKVSGRDVVQHLCWLRNRTRGHGATRQQTCTAAAPLIYKALSAFVEHTPILSRRWAYVQRHLSGRYRVVSLDGKPEPPSVSSDITLEDGVYVWLDAPRRVELVDCEADTGDFFVSNGGFAKGRFELLSYVRDERRFVDATPYESAPSARPSSETEGTAELGVLGEMLTNAPPLTPGYVVREGLEKDVRRLLDNDRHPVITLQGMGGVGKTSLALKLVTDVASSGRYGSALWFSARDIDLLEEGPKSVKPQVLSPDQAAEEYVRLTDELESRGGASAVEKFTTALAAGFGGEPSLFVFDNFETVTAPSELYEWIDTHVRLPNKVLITTRWRSFRGDYPVEIRGMTVEEFRVLVSTVARALELPELSNEEAETLYEESEGHPYVAKVLLGEWARHGRRGSVRRIMAGRDDLLEALFERTFVSLPPDAQRLFLALATAGVRVPEVAVEAVLRRPENPRIDVEQALITLRQSSLITSHPLPMEAGETWDVPLAAALFARRKLVVSPYKVSVETDAQLLRNFAPQSPSKGPDPALEEYVQTYAARIAKAPKEERHKHLPPLEYASRRVPAGWKLLAELYEELQPGWLGRDKAAEALRNYLEEVPNDDGAWRQLATLYRQNGDDWAGIGALIEAAELPGADIATIASAGRAMNAFTTDPENRERVSEEERRAMAQRLVDYLEPRLDDASATDCSVLAWLLVGLDQKSRAATIASQGLEREPENAHCKKLVERYGAKGRSARSDSWQARSKPSTRATDGRTERAPGDVAAAVSATLTYLRRRLNEPDATQSLSLEGIPLAQVGDWLIKDLPSVRPIRFGFSKLKDFLTVATESTEFCLVQRLGEEPPHPRLALRRALPPGTEETRGGTSRAPRFNVEDRYRLVLARGHPPIRLSNDAELLSVIQACVANRPTRQPSGTITAQLEDALGEQVSRSSLHATLQALYAATAFTRDVEGDGERTYSLRPNATVDGLLSRLRRTVEERLEAEFGSVNGEVLERLLPVSRAADNS